MATSVEAMTGMKSGKRKTHRGRRGGKKNAPPNAQKAPHAPAPQGPPPEALAALLGGGAPAPMDAGPIAAGPPTAQPGGDATIAHLIAALGALHGQHAGPGAPPPMMG